MGNWRRHVCCWGKRGLLVEGLGMGKMKGVFIILKEFLGSRKLHFGKPRVFFGGIALPLDKVLSTG